MASGRRALEPTKSELNIVKNYSVQEAANLCQRSRDTIRRWRATYLPGVSAKPGRPRRSLPAAFVAALGKSSDAELARQFKLPKNTVRNYRIEQAIPAYPRQGAVAA